MFRTILGGVLLAVLLTPSSLFAQDQRGGTFKSLQGNVLVQTDQEQHPAKPGEALKPGQRVVTGPKDAAALVLRDGTALVVGPGSSMGLTQFDYDPVSQSGNVLIDLYKGSMRMITGAIGKTRPETVKVRSPYAMTGIRGTDFITETD